MTQQSYIVEFKVGYMQKGAKFFSTESSLVGYPVKGLVPSEAGFIGCKGE